jgi:hypothetical protein
MRTSILFVYVRQWVKLLRCAVSYFSVCSKVVKIGIQIIGS